jgi:hypothetical protein
LHFRLHWYYSFTCSEDRAMLGSNPSARQVAEV